MPLAVLLITFLLSYYQAHMIQYNVFLFLTELGNQYLLTSRNLKQSRT